MSPLDAEPIDAVVLWVDGSDPAHRAKLDAHLRSIGRRPASAATTRFASAGEIEYCVASLFRYAPFLRQVHIVTDAQVPEFVRRARQWPAELAKRLKLVDHRDIFVGHEDCLPTFNSMTIEALIHRIPGLAERFLYLNDDFILIAPVQPQTWFRGEQIVLRGHWCAPPSRRIDRRLRAAWYRLTGQAAAAPRPGYMQAQAVAAHLAGFDDRFFELPHQPHPMLRSVLEGYFDAHPQRLLATLQHRLRDASQFVPQSLLAHLALRDGRAIVEPDALLLYVKPARTGLARLRRRLHSVDADAAHKCFACIQSLDEASAEAQALVTSWLDERVGRLP